MHAWNKKGLHTLSETRTGIEHEGSRC